MKIAFSVTGPDLARALAEIVRRAQGTGGDAGPPGDRGAAAGPPPGDTVSPAARRELSGTGRAGDERA